MARRSFSSLSLQDALELVPAQEVKRWHMDTEDRAPSDILLANLERLESFAVQTSEPARVFVIDLMLSEIAHRYPRIRIWKGEPLTSGSVGGVADFLIAPRRAYVETPLLCVIEAKRDNFVEGEVQCIAEMATCRDNNARDGKDITVHGIVSNGLGWVFYKLTQTPEVLVSRFYSWDDLPKLLGALDHVIAACADNIP